MIMIQIHYKLTIQIDQLFTNLIGLTINYDQNNLIVIQKSNECNFKSSGKPFVRSIQAKFIQH